MTPRGVVGDDMTYLLLRYGSTCPAVCIGALDDRDADGKGQLT